MKKENIHKVTSSGFETSKDYFESFEDRLLERLDEKELINASENTGYNVPLDYFDSVESKVLGKLAAKPEKPVIALKSRRTLYYVTGIAASFALLFSLIFNPNDNLSLDALDTAIIESYLYHEDYTNDDLVALFSSDDISEMNFIDINVLDETLNQYLEKTDTEDLILD